MGSLHHMNPRGGGGGGTLFFSWYVGLDPTSTIYPQKISGISGIPKKIFEKWTKKIWICTQEKALKCRNDPQKSPVCNDPPKISAISPYPKIFFFLKTPKNIEIQNFKPSKNVLSLHIQCISEYPPPPPPPPGYELLISGYLICITCVKMPTQK